MSLDRLTVVDESGRVYERWGVDIELVEQDDGKTLKIFVKAKEEADE